jgi:hypothetical protein
MSSEYVASKGRGKQAQRFVIHVFDLPAGPGDDQESVAVAGPFETLDDAVEALEAEGWIVDRDERYARTESRRLRRANILELGALPVSVPSPWMRKPRSPTEL